MERRFLCLLLVLIMVCAMLPSNSIQVQALSAGAGPKVIEGGKRDFIWPVPGWYGLSGCFIDNRSPAHNAIDIPANQGTEVVASYDGVVCKINTTCTHNYSKDYRCCDGFGNYVVLRHNYILSNGTPITLYSRYSHLTSVSVSEGNEVAQGDPIGTVGSTGYSGGMHLDFQILESNWQPYGTYSRDPFVNELLELPEGIYPASTPGCCGVGPTGCCCYYYLQDVKEIYSTPLLVEAEYPAFCALQVSSDETYLKTMPCSRESDPNSDDVMKLAKGAPLLATQLVQNKFGNLWYKVEAMSGEVGYVYAGDTTYVGFGVNDITAPGVTVPANHTQGKTYVLSGSVNSVGNKLTKVSVYVYSGTNTNAEPVTGGEVSPNIVGSYTLAGSPIDNVTYFNHLPVGTYTYVVSASYKNYYAVSAKEVSKPNEGTEAIYMATFNVVSGATSCSHTYTSEVTAAATCVKNGTRTYSCSNCGHSYTEMIPATGDHNYVGRETAFASCGSTGTMTYTCSDCSASYTETIPATGEHTWGGWGVRTEATCTTSGLKAQKCPVCYQEETEIIPATGHRYGSWVTIVAAGCTTDGIQEKTCSACGDVQTQTVDAIGHDYTSETIPANCKDPEKIRYTCQHCGDTYEKYTGEEYSDWSTIKPAGVAESLIESKTQYRYADYQTTTSYETSLDGYSQISSSWQNSGSGTVQYVKSWPSGFLSSHGLYSTYNKSAKSASEDETSKITINSDKITGYLYYHWCRGTYNDGPINRGTRPTQTGEFSAFHAFYSTTNPSTLTASSDGDGSYTYGNGSCCRDSHWYYCVPVYTQSYTTYSKLFTYGKWSDWSSWSDTVYTADSNRKVETQTVYRYVNTQLGEHTWNGGTVTANPDCTTEGVKTYTCTVCGDTKYESVPALNHNYQKGYCTRCDAKDPNYIFLTAHLQAGTVTGEPGDVVTVPVSISNNPGFAGFTFVFDYDSNAMTLTNITMGEVLNASDSGMFTKNVSGRMLNWTNTSNTTENGVLFNLTFKIADNAAAGEYAVYVALKDGSSTNFVDEGSHAQSITFENGIVAVTEDNRNDGDVDLDGDTDADDAVYLLLHILFGDEFYPITEDIALDMDGNAVVNTHDAVYLLLHTMFGKEAYPLSM